MTQFLGALLMLLVLSDVFLAVLYARIGAGILGRWLAYLTWRSFRAIAYPFRRQRSLILSFCGPTILVLMAGMWVMLLICGAALVIWPGLGTCVTARSGPTPTDFLTAMCIAGDTLTTIGAGDFTPHTSAMRMFYLLNSILGLSIITLTLTYYMQVYTALQRRNTFALEVDLATGKTGDAADLIASVGPRGQFPVGYAHLAEMAGELSCVQESHHFYPVLFYFRFVEPYYAVSRAVLVCLDLVSLMKSGLDDTQYGWLKESAALIKLWGASMQLLNVLADAFLPTGVPSGAPPDAKTREKWRARYLAALDRLRQAGIQTIADEQAGALAYIELRTHWNSFIVAFAKFSAQDLSDLDTAQASVDTARA